MSRVKFRFRDKSKFEHHKKIFSEDPLISVCEKKFKKENDHLKELKKHLETFTCQMKDLINTMENINDCNNNLYEGNWEGHLKFSQSNRESLKAWQLFLEEFKVNILGNLDGYLQEYPDQKKLLDSRNQKAKEYFKQKYFLDNLSKSKKIDETKLLKLKNDMETSRLKYDTENDALRTTLPNFIDNRIRVYITLWGSLFRSEETLYETLLRERQHQRELLDKLLDRSKSSHEYSIRNDCFNTNLTATKSLTQSTFSLLSTSTENGPSSARDNYGDHRGSPDNEGLKRWGEHGNRVNGKMMGGSAWNVSHYQDIDEGDYVDGFTMKRDLTMIDKRSAERNDGSLSRAKSYTVNSKTTTKSDISEKRALVPARRSIQNKPINHSSPDQNHKSVLSSENNKQLSSTTSSEGVTLKKRISFTRATNNGFNDHGNGNGQKNNPVSKLALSNHKPNLVTSNSNLQQDISDIDSNTADSSVERGSGAGGHPVCFYPKKSSVNENQSQSNINVPPSSAVPMMRGGNQVSKFNNFDNDFDDSNLYVDMETRPKSYLPRSEAEPEKNKYYYQVIARYRYKPQDEDELLLEKDDVILVLPWESEDQMEDGWLFGENVVTKTKGLFPENHTVPSR